MGVKLLVLCLIYQTIYTSSSGAVTLPFTDLVATVVPIKPQPSTLAEETSSLPRVPKSSDAVLEYFKSQFSETDLSSPIVCEYASPLVLTSSSRALPVPNTEKKSINVKELLTSLNMAASRLKSLPVISKLLEDNYDCPPLIDTPEFSVPCTFDLPNINPFSPSIPFGPNPYRYSAPTLPQGSSPLDSNILLNDFSSSSFIPCPSLPAFSELPINNNNLFSIIPKSLPSVTLGPYNNGVPSVFNPYSPQNQYSFGAMEAINPLYSIPYPMRYNQLSLPNVVTSDINLNSPSLCSFEKPYYSAANLPGLNSLRNTNALRDYPISNTDRIIKIPSSGCKISSDFQDTSSSYIESLTPYTRANILPAVSCKQNIPTVIPQQYSPSIYCPPKIPQVPIPTTYINVSPSYSLSQTCSNIVSSINDVISNLTQNILSAIVTPLIAKTASNPYIAPQRKITQVRPPMTSYPKSFYNPNTLAFPQAIPSPNIPVSSLTMPSVISLESSTTTLPNLASVQTEIFPFYDDSSYSLVTTDMSQITDIPSLGPVKVTILPPASFADYSPPQPCPSALPSPRLPLYSDLIPVLVEPPIMKLKSFDRNSKTIERLLELVFLAELINGDDYVDWDALDTVLAFLCSR